MISVTGLTKSYGDIQAVRGIDFYVEKGKLFAFLGTNGAGKSTTIDILCTLLQKDGGEVIIDGCTLGRDDEKIRESIGVVFQQSLLDPLLTVRENLMVRAGFYGKTGKAAKQAVEAAAKSAMADEFLDRRYGKLSGGQRRRADIARALINTPRLLFLDEPTTGLDPKTRNEVWETVSALQRNTGMTVFLTTHYMEEAASADYIIVINKGEIAAKGTPDALKAQYSSDKLCLMTDNLQAVCAHLDSEQLPYTVRGQVITVQVGQGFNVLPLLNSLSGLIDTFEFIHGTMDDVFLNITEGGSDNA